jgi:hypothetical protein
MSEPNLEQTYWEVHFSFVTRKECSAFVRAKSEEEAEGIVLELTSEVLERFPSEIFRGGPWLDLKEEDTELLAVEGPFTEEDF